MREDIFPAPRARKPGGGLGSPHPVAREWRRFTLASRVPVILSAALLALASGGNVFGLLINLGGLAILLRCGRWTTTRPPAIPHPRNQAAPDDRGDAEGVSLVALWSPFASGSTPCCWRCRG